jgi:hypothetical protein
VRERDEIKMEEAYNWERPRGEDCQEASLYSFE